MNFDYLIIGAGSAGCVLANRLSKNERNNVAIFEVGEPSDIGKLICHLHFYIQCMIQNITINIILSQNSHLHNRKLFCPRGKMIGGVLLLMEWYCCKGNPTTLKMVIFGLEDWSYNKVLPYFKKIETWSEGENEYRGGNGILPVNQSKNKNPLFLKLL